jgi:adenylate kinase
MITVFLGPPGSGKGTQAKRLMDSKKWPQISTGDMLRAAISAKTELGLKAKSFMDEGRLVPDEVVIGLIRDRMVDADCALGFILDGFPRTVAQAVALDEMLEQNKCHLGKVVLFEVDENSLVQRLTGRRTCSKCGAMYHLTMTPPKIAGHCDRCKEATLIQRDDDKIEVIQKRFKVYHEQTAPVASYYGDSSRLETIQATQSPDQVYSEVTRILLS